MLPILQSLNEACRMYPWLPVQKVVFSWYNKSSQITTAYTLRSRFLADRTNGRAIGTVLRLSSVVVCL